VPSEAALQEKWKLERDLALTNHTLSAKDEQKEGDEQTASEGRAKPSEEEAADADWEVV